MSSQHGASVGCGWRKVVWHRTPFVSAVCRVSKLSPVLYIFFLLLRAATCPEGKSTSLGPFSHTCVLKASLGKPCHYDCDTFVRRFPILAEGLDVVTPRICASTCNLSYRGSLDSRRIWLYNFLGLELRAAG
jgi:hypothetical protein